ncbi:MAG TPA: sigma-E factor negative regulatory protein, partial [Casimicrobiaceae bacterium]|nr:sigma-E factor negative regulatory protein [Casimicrobiaceae bacterium]
MGNFKTGSGVHGGAPAVPTPEEVSQLVDGELDAARAEVVIAGLCRAEGAHDWVCYHVIGEAMRGAT